MIGQVVDILCIFKKARHGGDGGQGGLGRKIFVDKTEIMFCITASVAVVSEVVLTGVEDAVCLGGEEHTNDILSLVDVA